MLEGLQDAFYDEIVEFVVDGKKRKWDVLLNCMKDKAIIQVFEGTGEYVPGQYTYQIDGTSDGGYCITGNAWKNL